MRRKKKGMVRLAGWLLSCGLMLASGGTVYGAVPVQMTRAEESCGYVEVPYEVHSIYEDGAVPALCGETCPAAYDSREHGMVSPVREQSPYGTCWAFATTAAMESALLCMGQSVDLSEYHLSYYNYTFVTDPLGGTAGDGMTCSGSFEKFLKGGNNVIVAFHALTNWIGAAAEETTGAPAATELEATSDAAYGSSLVHLQQMYQLYREDVAVVKNAIMEYGAVTAAFYYKAANYNTATGGYYNDVITTPNHAVVIVGWDDNYSRDNFKVNPQNDGAWLVKNSWGTDFGQEGYIWLSYEEISLGDEICVLLTEPADNYDNNYQYDGSFMSANLSYQNSVSAANIFTVPEGETKEELKAVAFETGNTNNRYSIQIYTDFQEGDPLSGTKRLEKPAEGTAVYQGYYTVELPKSVWLNPGEDFAVVITFEKDNGKIYVTSERSAVWNGTTYAASAQSGQSLISTDGGKSWQDAGAKYNRNLRIKAFTCNTDVEKDREKLPFTDVTETDWEYPYVERLYTQNIMIGKDAAFFGRTDALKRSECAVLLYQLENEPDTEYSQIFADVFREDWFALPVVWVYTEEIAAGYGNGIYGAEDEMTREQLAVMLYQYARYKGCAEEEVVQPLDFPDAGESSAYALPALSWCVDNGIISGRGGLLAPGENVTRGECAAMLSQLLSAEIL